MKYKPDSERKIKNGRIIECVVVGCKEKANSECLCWEHLKEKGEKYDE